MTAGIDWRAGFADRGRGRHGLRSSRQEVGVGHRPRGDSHIRPSAWPRIQVIW